ncbi:hypothetical protein [Enterococcus innesii]|uniref:hypothetical protein n=1 Tax=Enterococcus innesii TaxID=2839759 RepID=UPI002DB65490|nr:hypothetical protein [Enterococcus innesii]MEB5953176.1 hypothetical protein [Enterococcus innesii]
MSDKKLSIDDACSSSCELVGASQGLRAFATDRLSSLNDVSHDDLSVLGGMIAAVVALAEKHKTEMLQLEKED